MTKNKCIYEKWGVYFAQGCTDQHISEHTCSDWCICPKCGKEIEFYVEPEEYREKQPEIYEDVTSEKWFAEIVFEDGERIKAIGNSKMDVTLRWNRLQRELL